jgi:hypothetical protein
MIESARRLAESVLHAHRGELATGHTCQLQLQQHDGVVLNSCATVSSARRVELSRSQARSQPSIVSWPGRSAGRGGRLLLCHRRLRQLSAASLGFPPGLLRPARRRSLLSCRGLRGLDLPLLCELAQMLQLSEETSLPRHLNPSMSTHPRSHHAVSYRAKPSIGAPSPACELRRPEPGSQRRPVDGGHAGGAP